MKTICHPIDFPAAYPLERLGPPESLLFFDIETTGFSGDFNSVYLIGCVFFHAPSARWHMIQWFADTPESEKGLLTEFFALEKTRQKLIHFNGDTFDIPFLQKRCRRLGLADGAFRSESIDLYKKIRPFKTILALNSLKQKSVEQFLGVSRADTYSGGRLIQVYTDYLKSPDPFSFDLLLLHNEEDLTGMCRILPVLNYPDMLEQELLLASQRVTPAKQPPLPGSGCPPAHPEQAAPFPPAPKPGPLLSLVYESPCTFPRPFRTAGSISGSLVQGEGCRVSCRIPLFEGELKHFYPDYRDYYYLPFEDTAIHKSVGIYVDKSARKKATAKTCYTRKSGLFLPQASLPGTTSFRQEAGSKTSYIPYQKELLADPATAGAFLRQLLLG